MEIKLIILDAFGTCVEISQPKHPYHKLDVDRMIMARDIPFDQLTNDMSLKAELETELRSIRMFPDYPLFVANVGKIPIAIGSNLATPYAERLSEILQPVPDYFHLSCRVGRIKPDPHFYLAILNNFGCHPRNALMIGDSYQNDVEAPSRLGIECRLIDRTTGITLMDILDEFL